MGSVSHTSAPSTCSKSGGDLIIGQGCSAIECDEGAAALVTGGCVKTTLACVRLFTKEHAWEIKPIA